ncbi:MAG TPA: DUF2189 domain-containing protein [Caulobacteraceae bacterium]|jgi:uncharacterized membrane protein|nr:DUF2189 domain-containing protein [Caulobacteraceae bacterium]
MAGIQVTVARSNLSLPAIRRIRSTDLDWALAQGWRDFRQLRGDIVFLPLIYPIAGFFALVLAVNASFVPMVFPAVAGLSILGPAVSAGFYELDRRRDAGQDLTWIHFFDPLRRPTRGGLLLLTLGLFVLFALWLTAAFLVYRATIAAGYHATVDAGGDLGVMAFVRNLFGTQAGWTMIIVGNLIGLAFAVATLALTFVSFPMVVDRRGGAVVAVLTSLRVARLSPGATVGWGLRVAGLLAIGSLPLFVGLPIVLPVLGYATWRLYTRAVG